MTPSLPHEWSGDDWQDWCDLLFHARHAPAGYVRVPDVDGGDLGVEGYSVDGTGCMYQCYAGTATDLRKRYEDQRDKITTDLRKLVSNVTRMARLLGTHRMRSWILVVPLHDSKELVFHARKVCGHGEPATTHGITSQLDGARSDVRSLKRTLVQHPQAPARAVIEQQVRIAHRIEQLESLESGVSSLDEALSPLAARHLQLRSELVRMRGGGLSRGDLERLDALEGSIRDQLSAYGFSPVPPSEIRLARDSYLPERGDRPIAGKDISASDNVRLVWAYLVGLLEVARLFDTPHPGILALDEPGQQEVSDESLQALFARLDDARGAGQQVVVATSKPSSELAGLLDGRSASVNDFAGHTLQLRVE